MIRPSYTRYVFFVLILGLTASCGEERTLKEVGMAAIRDVMFDPDSAQFSNVDVASRKVGADKSRCVYGYVNGKNRFGGYTGKKPFIVFVGRDGEIVNASIGEYLDSFAEICGIKFR